MSHASEEFIDVVVIIVTTGTFAVRPHGKGLKKCEFQQGQHVFNTCNAYTK